MISIPYALDALNFLAADVRNLFGPFVNVFLVTDQHWSQTDVGLVTMGSGLLGIAFQTPIGAAIDVTRAKRGVVVLTMAAMTVAAAIIFVAPSFWPMAIALSVLAVAGDVFAPAVSALTLGLVTRDTLARRLGRNSAFDHGGNITIALLAGAVWLIGVQLLDGIGAGIYQALTPLIISDIMRGTGRFNLAQGAVATTMGIGASVSGLAAGLAVDHFGYSVSFLVFSAAAAVAFLVFFGFMPETRDEEAIKQKPQTLAIEGTAGGE
jgi:MFS family permease